MAHSSLLGLFFLSLSFSVNGLDPDMSLSLPDLTHVANFHSRVFHRNLISSESFYIEEYYDSDSGRGRLDTDGEGQVFITYYNNATMQSQRIHRETDANGEDKSICYVNDVNKIISTDTGSDWGTIDVDPDNKLPLIMGPSAIWRKVVRELGVDTKKNNNIYWSNKQHLIRGIKCNKFQALVGPKDALINITLYFMDTKFEKIDMPTPIRINVKGEIINADNQQKQPIHEEIDYFLFEPYPQTWLEFRPLVGIGCEKRKSQPGVIFPGSAERAFPDRLAVSFETFNLVESSKEARTHIHKYDMYFDGEHEVARVDTYSGELGDVSVTFDTRRGVTYSIINNEKCIIGHVENSPFIKESHALSQARTVQEILKMDGNYNYLGDTFKRGVYTEVWEKIERDYAFESFAQESGGQNSGKMDKAVITHFFTSAQVIEFDAEQTHVPVQTLLTGYMKDGNQFVKKYEQEINFFNFRSLFYGKAYTDVFDIRDCYPAAQDRRYFDLFIDTQGSQQKKDFSKFTRDFKQNTVLTISKAVDISPLRIPMVEIDFLENGLLLNLLILEKPPASASFKLKSTDSSPTMKDGDPYPNTDKETCATLASASTATGFLYCDTVCFIMTRTLDDAPGPSREEGYTCEFYGKVALMKDGVETDLFMEKNLREVKETLDQLVLNQKLMINLTEEQNIVSYTVASMADGQTPIDNVNSQRMFENSEPGYKLKDIETTTTLEDSAFVSLGDCYLACRDMDGECQSFSFCRRNGAVECKISTELITESTDAETKFSNIEADTQCSVYIRSYLQRFVKNPFKTGPVSDGVVISTKTDVECARLCTYKKEKDCKSFEFCDNGRCVLRKEHFLGISEGDDRVSNMDSCSLYTEKHMNEFYVVGSDLVDESILTNDTGITAEVCATLCAENTDCVSINYCSKTTQMASKCEITGKSALDDGVVTRREPEQFTCRNYGKLDQESTGRSKSPQAEASTAGMSGGGFFALVFIMFLVGVAAGIGGYVGFMRYKLKKRNESGLGINVRFVRHKDEEI